jgi:hypothetical protein
VPNIYRTDDGTCHVAIRTGAFDLLEAAEEGRRRKVDAYEDLLLGLESHLQVIISSRRAAGAAARSGRLREYLAARSIERPHYSRRVHLVLSQGRRDIEVIASRLRSKLGRGLGQAPDPGPALLRHAEGIVLRLRALGIGAGVLDGPDLERYLGAELPAGLTQDGTLTDWEERADVLRLDGVSYRTYFLDAYPGFDLSGGWLGSLVDIPAEYDLSLHLVKVPTIAALRHLSTRIRDLQAARMSDAATQAVADPLAEAGLPEAVGLRRDIASNQEGVFVTSLYLTLRASDEASLGALSQAAEEAASRCLARLLPATFQMASGRLSTLPVGIDAVAADRFLPGSVVATGFPWLWDDLQQPAGHFVGTVIRGGAPVLLDAYDEERFSNANVGVFGHSGAGKTYLMKSLMLADADAGIGAFIIDPEAEYRDVCESAKGQWVDLSLGSGHSINVMDPALGAVDDRDPIGDQVSDLLDLIGTMCGALGEDDKVDVDDALRAVLGRSGGTLDDVRRELERTSGAPRVARSLRRWTEGQLGELFSAPTNVRFDAPIVAFALRDLKEELLPVAYFLIAQWIWARVRSERRRRRVLFDEVGLMFEYPLVRRFLVRLARRIRKYQGSLCLVTQNAGDLLSSDQGLVLATNPAVLFLGAQRHAEAQRLQRAFGLTESQTDFIAAARRSEFLLLAGDSRHRIRVEAPPWIAERLS